jgi:histidinol-phosphatase
MNAGVRARYDVAVEATEKAGRLALDHFDGGIAVEWKKDNSPVTLADRAAEQFLRKTLLGKFPEDGFLGEEYGHHPGTSGFRWIVDPIDGTRNYVRNIPIWGTLVGLTFQGKTVAGVIAVPPMGLLYRALRGDGAYRGERRIHVSKVDSLAEATIFYTSLSWFQRAERMDDFLELSLRTQVQRGYGDFYGHLLVAQGSGDLMVEAGVHIWDVAAIQPIVEEAGGRFSDWDGNVTIERPDVVISNGVLHDEALRVLRTRRPPSEGTT